MTTKVTSATPQNTETYRGLVYAFDSYVPTFFTQLPDPFRSLSNFFDTQKLFGETALLAAERYDTVSADTTKKASLKRRLMGSGKDKGVSSLPAVGAESSASAPASAKKQRPGTEISDSDNARLQAEIADLVAVESKRILADLEASVEPMISVIETIANFRSKPESDAIRFLVPHVLLDRSITKHPRMKSLRLFDNTTVIDVGRAQLLSYVYCYTVAQGYSRENAERRFAALMERTGSWLTHETGRLAKTCLPVAWHLHADTHTLMTEREVAEQEERMMREVPLLVVGVLHFLRLEERREAVIQSLVRYAI